jgi:predicted SAM-dependent methyltransferase
VKLNLGCGENYIQDDNWINIDLYNDKADLKHDLFEPLPYPDNSVELIYAHHVIEHLFSNREEIKGDRHDFTRAIFADWYRVLKPGGFVEVYLPDIVLAVKMFIDGLWSYGEMIGSIYGVELSKEQKHSFGFSFEKVKELMESVGFGVERMDGKENYDEVKNLGKEKLRELWGEQDLSGHVAFRARK